MASSSYSPSTELNLVGVAYLRQSQASGKGGSEDAQDEAIRDTAERLGIDLKYVLPFDAGQSSFTLERPSFKEALRILAELGPSGRLIVSKLNRLTRRRKHWEQILELTEEQGWKPVSAEFPELDLLSDTGRMIAGMFIDQGEREYRDKRKDGDNSRRFAVVKWGAHGGSTPPLGYAGWTERVDEFGAVKRDRKGRALRGPLYLADDGTPEKVLAAFQCYADGGGWRQVIAILGVKSIGAARNVLDNLVYTGQARSGEYTKDGAHPRIVSDEMFADVQRRLSRQSDDKAATTRRSAVPNPLSKVLRCGVCGGLMTPENGRNRYLRCKKATQGLCDGGGSIAEGVAFEGALAKALGWHEQHHPLFMLNRDTNDAIRPGLVQALHDAETAAEAAADGLGMKVEELPAHATPVRDVAAAKQALHEADIARGWFGRTPEQVREALEGGNAETTNSFLLDAVRVIVYPVGRHATKEARAFDARCKVLYLVGGQTASGEQADKFLPERIKKGETWVEAALPEAPLVLDGPATSVEPHFPEFETAQTPDLVPDEAYIAAHAELA